MNCYYEAMDIIKKERPFFENPCVIVDLEETFIQDRKYMKYTSALWNYNAELCENNIEEANKGRSPIMPFMYILYAYCVKFGVKVIFVSRRGEHERKNVEKTLKRHDINNYMLFMGDCRKNIVKEVAKKWHILVVLNDQADLKYKKIVKFPSLYYYD